MSVDHRASSGIGYKVTASEEIEDSEALEDGLNEYLYGEIGDEFEHFESGSYYSGIMDGTFLVLKEPFKDGLDLTAGKEKLRIEIERLKLDAEGELDVVVGLLVF